MNIKKYIQLPIYITLLLLTQSSFAEENKETNETIDSSHFSVEQINYLKNENDENETLNSSWEQLDVDDAFYDDPYQISLFSPQHGEDSDRLLSKTTNLFFYGLGAIGTLAVLPEDITNWEDQGDRNLGERWIHNVKRGPVWDRDSVTLNYVMHPYVGVNYYMAARKSGYRQWDSFVYSTLMSTVFWEFGVEAFGEIPSIADLFVTPIMGWVYGEWAFNTEREIWDNGGTVYGNKYLGYAALVLLDPVDYVGRTINKYAGYDVIKAGTSYIKLSETDNANKKVSFEISYTFGEEGNAAEAGISGKRKATNSYSFIPSKDPISSGIVGISLGTGKLNFDSKRGHVNEHYAQASIGLYFTPSFSTRLNYASTKQMEKIVEHTAVFESFSVDGQYYFNSDSDFRPYITAGIGEEIWEEDNDTYNFQVNTGLGIHYKLNSNWALQAEAVNYYTDAESSNDQQVTGKLVYRFSVGEDK